MKNQFTLREVLFHTMIPVIMALVMAFICQPVYMTDGKCDYGLLLLLIGIPFGVMKMFIWFFPRGLDISGTLGVIVLNFLIGGLIGSFLLVIRVIFCIGFLVCFFIKKLLLWRKR